MYTTADGWPQQMWMDHEQALHGPARARYLARSLSRWFGR